MHECPECGQACNCNCDCEDTWFDSPDDCTHDCDPDYEDGYDDDDLLFDNAPYPSRFEQFVFWLRWDVWQELVNKITSNKPTEPDDDIPF